MTAIKDPLLDEYMERLTRNDPSLTILNLNNAGIGSTHQCHRLAMALRHNTHLVVLFLNNNGIYGTSPAVQELAMSIGRHPALSFVYMSFNHLGDAGATVLAEHALLSSSPRQREQSGRRRQHCLQVLKLAHNDIGPRGAQALGQALQKQQRTTTTTSSDADSTAGCWGLQSLVLEHNRLGTRGLVELAKAMRGNPCLRSLNVRHNQVTPTAAGMLRVQAEFLASLRDYNNRTLSELLLLEHNNDDNNNNENSSSSSAVGQELQYHVEWNRIGRYSFGDASIPATAWTRVLGQASSSSSSSFQEQQEQQQHDAPSLLFTTLRARPDLLQQQQPQPSS